MLWKCLYEIGIFLPRMIDRADHESLPDLKGAVGERWKGGGQKREFYFVLYSISGYISGFNVMIIVLSKLSVLLNLILLRYFPRSLFCLNFQMY